MPSRFKSVTPLSSSYRLRAKGQPLHALSILTASILSAGVLASPSVLAEPSDPGSRPAIPLEPTTISATRQARAIDSVPNAVSVQQREEMDRQNANTIRDLVRYEPGVSVGGAGQRAGTTGYNIRGIDGDRILTQVDGVETPASFFFGPFAESHRNYVDPEIIQRVEILRGPASSLYGSSAIGGAVSYFTLNPDNIIKEGQSAGARLKTGYSSADRSWLKSATVAGREGEFDALLHASERNGRETSSYGETGGSGVSRTRANPENNDATNLLAKLGWNYAQDSRFGLTYEKYENDRDTHQRSAIGGPFGDGIGQGMYKWRDSSDLVTRERFGLEHTFKVDSLLADNVKWSLNHQIAKTEQHTYDLYNVPARTGQRPTHGPGAKVNTAGGHAGSAIGKQSPSARPAASRPDNSHGAHGQPTTAQTHGGGPASSHGPKAAAAVMPGRLIHRERDTVYRESQWVLDTQLDKAFSVAQTDHVLTYGATLKQQKTTGERSGNGRCALALGSCKAMGDDSPAEGLKPTSDFPDPTVTRYGLFAQDEIRWNDWTFTPGLRYDHTRLDPKITQKFLAGLAAEKSSTGTPSKVGNGDQAWHRFSPKLGVTYALSDQYTWYGQYAEGFRTPTAKALYGRFESAQGDYVIEPNPALKPEKSKSYETGLRGHFDAGWFDVAVFHNKYQDFINEDALAPGYDQTKFQSANIKHATINGLEIKSRLGLDVLGAPEGLYSLGSVAYARGRNDDTGKPINSINPLTGVLGLGYDQSSYGALLSWTLIKRKTRVDDSTFKAPDGTSSQFKTPGAGVLDLTAHYKVTDDLTINSGIYNLADKKYWRWDDVRGFSGSGEGAVISPANLDRLTQPGRNFGVNFVWNI
ncbi:TonB-dependent hemoglobin/transferrin/lactoferrin family receptor [Pseudomonas huanghezhanensis]|uniref:TonB-dependent hemoglobin/transferrin/lactoferrin family receptor n=1 Tax=Pseudomonas huanghezhanensis TaxID=3002903 RepID=UPI002E1ECA41